MDQIIQSAGHVIDRGDEDTDFIFSAPVGVSGTTFPVHTFLQNAPASGAASSATARNKNDNETHGKVSDGDDLDNTLHLALLGEQRLTGTL